EVLQQFRDFVDLDYLQSLIDTRKINEKLPYLTTMQKDDINRINVAIRGVIDHPAISEIFSLPFLLIRPLTLATGYFKAQRDLMSEQEALAQQAVHSALTQPLQEYYETMSQAARELEEFQKQVNAHEVAPDIEQAVAKIQHLRMIIERIEGDFMNY